MIIKNIILNNFQLFPEANVSLEKLNVIVGENHDNVTDSSNGSGKTTLAINAVLFALYGEVPGIVLKDLPSFDKNTAFVNIEIEHASKTYIIKRKIPSELSISIDGVEVQKNTPTLKQHVINDIFGNFEFFRQFRIIDLKKGIDLLGLGTVSLRKMMMGLIDDSSNTIRTNLLAQKCEKEQFSQDKKLYKFYCSQKRLDILNNGIKRLQKEVIELNENDFEQSKVINTIAGSINSKNRLIQYKESDKKQLNGGICPILKTKCQSLTSKLDNVVKDVDEQIKILKAEIDSETKTWNNENELSEQYKVSIKNIKDRIFKAQHSLVKLQEATKFSEYKYTKKDIEVYNQAIKTLDTFVGIYIQEWLISLQTIINNLINPLNISIEFVSDKEFIKIKDNGRELKYDQLSSGQKTFLGAIFKLGILLQKNMEGIVLIDEGIGAMDKVNLKNFLEICKTLPFQIITIYQNYDLIDEQIKTIKVERKNGVSKCL